MMNASMRPPEFTGGNHQPRLLAFTYEVNASMRPPEFTGGNLLERRKVPHSLLLLQ